jgi:hypothetical protein
MYVLLHFLRQLCVCVRAQRGSHFSRRETRPAEDKHAEKRAMQGAFKSAAESELNFTALLTFRFLILLPVGIAGFLSNTLPGVILSVQDKVASFLKERHYSLI